MPDESYTEFRNSNADGLLVPGLIGTAMWLALFLLTDALSLMEGWMIAVLLFLVVGYWIQFLWRKIHPTVYLTIVNASDVVFVREHYGEVDRLHREQVSSFCESSAKRFWQSNDSPSIVCFMKDGSEQCLSQWRLHYCDQDRFLRAIANHWGCNYVCEEDRERLSLVSSAESDEP